MPIKVLSIDDDVNMTKLLGILLRGYGIDAISANSSELGIELARHEKPDVITLDLMMPHISGWKLCNIIRSFSKTPIIVISAMNDPVGVAAVLEAGANDYIVKPVKGNRLVASINKFTSPCE
jgi:two-component system response regulator MtrA